MRAPPSRTRRAATVVAALVVALLAMEGGLRLFYYAPTVEDPAEGTLPLGGETTRACIEGCGASTMQPGGLRRATPFDPASPAILSIGDSFTAAMQVDDAETFTSRLEERLKGDGRGLAVLNVGRSAYSVADYVTFAPALLERWKPLWTVVQLNEPDFGAEAWSASNAAPHFEVDDDGEPELVAIPRSTKRRTRLLGPILRHSALLQFAFYRWNQLTQSPEPPLFRAGSAPKTEGGAAKPWEVDGRAAALTRMLAGAFGEHLTLLYLPHGRADGTLDPPSRIEAEFDVVCAESSLSCVNMRDVFEGMLVRHEPPFGFSNTTMNVGHLNANGHAAVGAALFDELSRRPLHRAADR